MYIEQIFGQLMAREKQMKMINIKIKNFNLEEEIDLFVIDSEYFKEDILIGLN